MLREVVPFICTAEDGKNATEFTYFLDEIVLEIDSALVYKVIWLFY